MPKEIMKTIKEAFRYKLKRKDILFIIKKVIGQTNILEKYIKISRISLTNRFLKGLISK